MAKFLKLTYTYDEGNTELELANADDISNVYPETEEQGSLFNKKTVLVGSKVLMKNGDYTYVNETPEQILAMIEGA